jgi:hypothetical protein
MGTLEDGIVVAGLRASFAALRSVANGTLRRFIVTQQVVAIGATADIEKQQ